MAVTPQAGIKHGGKVVTYFKICQKVEKIGIGESVSYNLSMYDALKSLKAVGNRSTEVR